MRAMRKVAAVVGGALVGLVAVLAFAGPAAASGTLTRAGERAVTAEAPAPGPAQEAAQEGEWRYVAYFPADWVCEAHRIAVAQAYPTDGCFYAPGLGYYFWYYVA